MTKPFTTQLTVRVSDLNYGGHLAHDKLVSLLHQARCDFLAQYGASELDCGAGVGLILRHLEVDYRAEGHFQDTLDIALWTSDVRAARFNLNYRVRRGAEVIATAQTQMVGFDYKTHHVAALCEPFRAQMIEACDG